MKSLVKVSLSLLVQIKSSIRTFAIFSKNGYMLRIKRLKTLNVSFTIDVVSFEEIGPGFYHTGGFMLNTTNLASIWVNTDATETVLFKEMQRFPFFTAKL